MPIIAIVAFQGIGPFYDEPALVRLGHVALQGVIEAKLIGFSPTPEAIETIGDEVELFKRLRSGEAQPGCLQDDTAIFLRTKELSLLNERVTVWELTLEISDQTLATIKQWYNEKREAPYNFPDRKGIMEPDQYNCATFLGLLNVPIPSNNGQLQFYLEAMIAQGARKW